MTLDRPDLVGYATSLDKLVAPGNGDLLGYASLGQWVSPCKHDLPGCVVPACRQVFKEKVMISIRKHYLEGAVLGQSFFNFLKYSLGKTITFTAQTFTKRVNKIKEK